VRNLHVSLPDTIYRDLRDEAECCKRPAISLDRQATEIWLRHHRKIAQHRAIATFAAEDAGSPLDLDSEWEAASADYLVATKEDKH